MSETRFRTLHDGSAAIGDGLPLYVRDLVTAVLDVSISGVATVAFEVQQLDGGVWSAVSGVDVSDSTESAMTSVTGVWRFSVSALYAVRARISAYTSGDVTVEGSVSNGVVDVAAIEVLMQEIADDGELAAVGSSLQRDSNLSDLSAPVAARGHIGLGTSRITESLMPFWKQFFAAHNYSGARPVTIEYVDADTHHIYQPIDGIHWLRTSTSLNSDGVLTMDKWRVIRKYSATNDDDSGIVYIGAWTHDASGGALGDTRSYSLTPTDYLEFDVTGAKELHLFQITRSNAGHALIEINGSQELLDKTNLILESGSYVLDGYSAATIQNVATRIAQGLDPSKTYSIRVTVNGTHNVASSNDYVWFSGYGIDAHRWDESISLTGDESTPVNEIVSTDSGYAIAYQPDGATGGELAGGDHLNTSPISASFVDCMGNAIELDAITSAYTSQSVSLVQSYYLRHSETGAINHAIITDTMEFSANGVKQSIGVEWLSNAAITYMYAGMLPVTGDTDRGHVIGDDNTVYDLTTNDNSSYGKIESYGAVIWASGHPFAVTAFVNPASLAFFDNSSSAMAGFIEDKTGTVNKIYFNGRYGSSALIGDFWRGSWRFECVRIPNLSDYV